MEICKKCGLPQEFCVCESIFREAQKIKVRMERRRFGKKVTVIEGLSKDVNIEDVTKKLKSRLACGGTSKGNTIELQGDHRRKVGPILVSIGFPQDTIEAY